MRGAKTASARTRIVVAGAVGLACGLAASTQTAWHVAALAGWDGAAAVFNAWVWYAVQSLSPADACRLATGEDPSRAAADLLLLAASVASLLGAGLTLVEAADTKHLERAVLVGLAISSVGLSWVVVQTVFMLRYARLYYAEPTGGIDFPGDEAPAYRDFAYLAVTLGMTFQVSDTALTSSAIRATALRQALLSYLFSVCIVGLTINVVAGLFR